MNKYLAEAHSGIGSNGALIIAPATWRNVSLVQHLCYSHPAYRRRRELTECEFGIDHLSIKMLNYLDRRFTDQWRRIVEARDQRGEDLFVDDIWKGGI